LVPGMETLCDLLFEVSNEDRMRILLQLEEGALNITNLSRELGITTQEASRHVSRLADVGLTERDADGLHGLTPYGELVLRQIQGLNFTSQHVDYFKSHSLAGLPAEFVHRLSELAGSVYVDDVMVMVHNVEKLLKEVEEYILNINTPYISSTFPLVGEAFGRGVEAKFIHSRELVPPDIMVEEHKQAVGKSAELARVSGDYLEKVMEGIDLVLYMSEKEVAILAFPLKNGRFDFFGFSATDESSLKWCRDLFMYYWERGETKR